MASFCCLVSGRLGFAKFFKLLFMQDCLRNQAGKGKKKGKGALKRTRSRGLKRLRCLQHGLSEDFETGLDDATAAAKDSEQSDPLKKCRKSKSAEAKNTKAKAAKGPGRPRKSGKESSKASGPSPKAKASKVPGSNSPKPKPVAAEDPEVSEAKAKAGKRKAEGSKPKKPTASDDAEIEGPAPRKRTMRRFNGSQSPDPERVEALVDLLRKFSGVGYTDAGLDLDEQRFRPTVHLNIYWSRNHVGVSIKKKGKLEDAGCNFTSKTTTIATHLQLANWCVSGFN